MTIKYCNNCRSYVTTVVKTSIIEYNKEIACPYCGGKNLSKEPTSFY